MYIAANITDANGDFIGSRYKIGVKWGGTVNVDSKLKDAMTIIPQPSPPVSKTQSKRDASFVEMEAKGVNNILGKRLGGPQPGQSTKIIAIDEGGPINFTVGSQAWGSDDAACHVGGWDIGDPADALNYVSVGRFIWLVPLW